MAVTVSLWRRSGKLTAPVARLSTPEIPSDTARFPNRSSVEPMAGRRLMVAPAMEAKVTDHVWSLEEIAGLAKIRFDKTPPNP